jgi:uroporphyrin-III C-methyltransferase
MTTVATGTVYLVGAGPGDPELLTLKAARLLAEAGVVLHDDLVPQSILDLAGKQTLVMSVGKRCGRKKITQATINDMMISSARQGLAVVRLKSGDPMIFGRAGEEMDALRAAQVPFVVVPGVTAASSAAALVGASLTRRGLASKLIVLSGHHAAGETLEHAFAPSSLPEDATLAIYMPGSDLVAAAAALVRSGLSGSTPCVVVRDASRPTAGYQAVRLTGLEHLYPATGPRLLLVGRVFESLLGREAGQPDASEQPAQNHVQQGHASVDQVVEQVREHLQGLASLPHCE